MVKSYVYKTLSFFGQMYEEDGETEANQIENGSVLVIREDYEKLVIALRDMHRMVHDHVYRSGTSKGFPEGARTIGPEVLKGINGILREALGRDDPSLKYFSLPDDPPQSDGRAEHG